MHDVLLMQKLQPLRDLRGDIDNGLLSENMPLADEVVKRAASAVFLDDEERIVLIINVEDGDYVRMLLVLSELLENLLLHLRNLVAIADLDCNVLTRGLLCRQEDLCERTLAQ